MKLFNGRNAQKKAGCQEKYPFVSFIIIYLLYRRIVINNITMQSGTGIQELMAAEQRASQIVAEARVGESMIVDDGEWYD